jgi:biotin carboxyl carrier protein
MSMKKYNMKINGQKYETNVLEFNALNAKLLVNGVEYNVEFDISESETKTQVIQVEKTVPVVPQLVGEIDSLKAPLPSLVVSILKNAGDSVRAGEVVMILEAMKMEHEIYAPFDGVIDRVMVTKSQSVTEGEVLLKLSRG